MNILIFHLWILLPHGVDTTEGSLKPVARSYRFDSLHRLRALEEGLGTARWLARDLAGRAQVETTTNLASGTASVRVFPNDGWRRIAASGASGSKRFICGRALDELLVQESDSEQLAPIASSLGSTMKLIGDAGAIVDQFRYDAYGAPLAGDATAFSRLFAGAIYDHKSKLYDLRHRHYDPKIGRFLSRDPLGQHADGANTGNAYAYVGNNPLNRRDPLGLLTGDEKIKTAPQFPFHAARLDSLGRPHYVPISTPQPTPSSASFCDPFALQPYNGPTSNMISPIPSGEPIDTIDGVQLALDGAGMTEPFGAIADGANAVIYAFRGQWGNAGLSCVSLLPLVGWISGGAKLARKADSAIEAATEGPGIAKCREPFGSNGNHGNDDWNRSQPGNDRLPQNSNPGNSSGSGGGSGKGPGKGSGPDFPIDPDEVDGLLRQLHDHYIEIERMRREFTKTFPHLVEQLQNDLPLEPLKQDIIRVVGGSNPKADHAAYQELVALLGRAKSLAHQTQKKTSVPLN